MNGNISGETDFPEASDHIGRQKTVGELGTNTINHFDLGEQRAFLDGILERAGVVITLVDIPTAEPV